MGRHIKYSLSLGYSVFLESVLETLTFDFADDKLKLRRLLDISATIM